MRQSITSVQVDLTQDIDQVSDVVSQRINDSAQQYRAIAQRERRAHHPRARPRRRQHDRHARRTRRRHSGAAGAHQPRDHACDRRSQRPADRRSQLQDRPHHRGIRRPHHQPHPHDGGPPPRGGAGLRRPLDRRRRPDGGTLADLTETMHRSWSARRPSPTRWSSGSQQADADTMLDRSQQISEMLVERRAVLAETITTSGDEVNASLKSTGDFPRARSQPARRRRRLQAGADRHRHHRDHRHPRRCRDRGVPHQRRASWSTASPRMAIPCARCSLTRLQAFEEMFSQGGSELADRIARDSSTLGSLITRHRPEFDQTVKTYGGELVERLGQRTEEVSDAMRTYVDSFDTRSAPRPPRSPATLDQRLTRFQDALDSRTQTLNDALSSRVMDIARTLAEGGKEVVAALDKRIGDVTGTINAHGTEAGRTPSAPRSRHQPRARRTRRGGGHDRARRSTTSLALAHRRNPAHAGRGRQGGRHLDRAPHRRGQQHHRRARRPGRRHDQRNRIDAARPHARRTRGPRSPDNLDTRIARFENLLVDRAMLVTDQLVDRAKTAADLLEQRVQQMSTSISSQTNEASRSLGELSTKSSAPSPRFRPPCAARSSRMRPTSRARCRPPSPAPAPCSSRTPANWSVR